MELMIAHVAVGSGLSGMKPLEQRDFLRGLIEHTDNKWIREAAREWLGKLIAGNAETIG